ncbi:MAG: hypothetical protein L0154_16125 [Chloroflexi bacterium]|nr:hypothetical protein [Chloroflexota bacterium]
MFRKSILITAILLLTVIIPVHAQDGPDDPDEFYVLLNQGLISEGQHPLARSEILNEIAQTIANEVVDNGASTSFPRELARALDYPLWPDNSQRVISTPYVRIGILSPQEVANLWDGPISANVALDGFREVGIATTSYVPVRGGNPQDVYVVVLGAQPNVIPLIINDGADVVTEQDVELYIHNEESLDYETDEDVVQRIVTVKIANSEAELADAEPLLWEDTNFGVPWELTDEFGEKSVWVELEDRKGAAVRYEATVEYADPETLDSGDDTAEVTPALIMTYGGNSFTLQVQSPDAAVNIQDILFSWLNDTRTYELANAGSLAEVDLEAFEVGDCIQITLGTETAQSGIAGCNNIFVDNSTFTELARVFWNPEFIEFKVFDGDTELGICSTREQRCQIELP